MRSALASVLLPRQGEGLRARGDRRRGPAVEERGPVARGGGGVLPVARQARGPASRAASGARSADPDPDPHADTPYELLRAGALEAAPPLVLHLLVRRGPVFFVHETWALAVAWASAPPGECGLPAVARAYWQALRPPPTEDALELTGLMLPAVVPLVAPVPKEPLL
ncbi:hypothetical protein KM043_002382 [Ampulex compressa]|nr:hypothetical protein KM043_002382 [Ampulex compressa]